MSASPREIRKTLDQALGGQKIPLRTLVKFGGVGVTTDHVPAGQFTEDGMKATWKAVSGTVSTQETKINASEPGLTMDREGAGNLVTVGNARFSVTLSSIAGSMNDPFVFALDPVAGDGGVQSNAKFVTSGVKGHIAWASLQDKTLDNVRLNVSL